VHPLLLSIINQRDALLQNPTTNEKATVSVGQKQWGWMLVHIEQAAVTDTTTTTTATTAAPYAVLEFKFDEWAQIAYISQTGVRYGGLTPNPNPDPSSNLLTGVRYGGLTPNPNPDPDPNPNHLTGVRYGGMVSFRS
jgi:hypothetical protein